MKNNSLALKVFLGYFVAVSMLAVVVVFTLVSTAGVKSSSNNISQHQVPALATSLSLLSEINRSLSALKGWVSIKEDRQRDERATAWQNIDSSFYKLRKIARDQSNNNLENDLERLKNSLEKLRDYQQKIESISHTLDNTPGLKLLVEDASPQADLILNGIDRLIDIEYQRSLSFDRRDMLRRMNDFRFSMSNCMASIRAYLISNDQKHLLAFNVSWAKNEADLKYIQRNIKLLTADQRRIFSDLVQARDTFILYPDQMFDYRQGPEWDTAILLMDKWIGPIESKIKIEIENIIITHEKEMKKRFSSINSDFDFLLSIGAGLLILSIIVCSFLAIFVTRLVIGPLQQVINTANSIAQGDFDVDMDIKGSYEAESLRDSLINMTEFLKRIASHARLVASGNLDADFSPRSDRDTLGVALQKMTVNLKTARTESDALNWIKTGQAKLSEELRGLVQVKEITTVALGYISQYVQASCSSLYFLENNCLVRSTSYIQRNQAEDSEIFELGEGMVGQTALNQNIMVYKPLPSQSFMRCNFGLGESTPTSIVCVPLISDRGIRQSTMGVVVFGTDIELDDKIIELFGKFSECLSSAIEMANSRSSLQQLLEESQQQAEELQSQQEELRVANEELEQKAHALQVSEEEMKSQSEDLKNSNQVLEQQKSSIETKSKELEQTSKYKSEFMANMSHELRTPLNSLLILSESLSRNHDDNLTGEQVEDARVIFEAGSSLLSLINDILDLSKVEAGKLKLHPELVDLELLVTDIIAQFKPISESSHLDFSARILSNELKVIYTDRMRLEQILRNLLSNAFKFTSQGSVSLEIYIQEDLSLLSNPNLSASTCVAFAVKDTGIGIKKKKQKLIFDAFQQADGSTCRVYGGSGLGLTISKEMAKMLDGELSLYSTEGIGSEFTLYLPACKTDALPAIDSHRAEDHNAFFSEARSYNADPSPLHISISDDRDNLLPDQKSVLIIEDDLAFSRKLAEASRAKGFKCLLAHSGKQALALVKHHSPSAVILDIGLPDVNGIDVLEKLKIDPKTRRIPVHIISGQDSDEIALKKGAIGFITKPVLFEDIEQVLSKFEVLIQKNIRRILLMDSQLELVREVEGILEGKGIDIQSVGNTREALTEIPENTYDCYILNLSGHEDTGYWSIDNITDDSNTKFPPVIIYTDQSLSETDYEKLLHLTDRIIVKGVKSSDRLKDELDCFLYSVNDRNPVTNQLNEITIASDCLKGRKILLVDDDLRNTYALSKELRRYGAIVHLADNGELAITKIAKETDIDLILMDIMMPVMDGYETMSLIRNRYSTSIPIIAITAKAMTGDKERCIESGANDYLSKPVNVDQLVTMVKLWVSK